MPLTGETCPICKFPRYREEHDGGEFVSEGCSDFCATQDDAVLLQFGQLKAGDWGVWPCSECGCAVDDEYEPGPICSKCVHPRAARVRGELLKEAAPYLPRALLDKVMAELEGKKPPEPHRTPRYERPDPV